MLLEKEITFIPATVGRFAPVVIGVTDKKRVAAYARVSTDNEEQLSSYEAQVDYYTRQIEENPAWQMVDVYSDEGISATSTKKRDGFNRMIADSLEGKVDLIITKSVSRFARNTVDTLTTVRQLKEKGVEVFFEKENIYTMDSKGELLITIMSSLAQEESRSISENVTWGQRKRFADGKVSLPYGRFLGYEKGEDGLPKIVDSEAEVVRLIYKMFFEGKAINAIVTELENKEITTPCGKRKWHRGTVLSILSNEKYCGNALLQKTYTVDFLTKEKKINNGEIPQYFVENSHPAIIPPETFDLVQHEINKRKQGGNKKCGNNVLSGKIICGDCGDIYGSKIWHSTSKYKRTIWQCNSKFKNKCSTPHFNGEIIKKAFVDCFNSILSNEKEIISGCETVIKTLTDTTAIDKEIILLNDELKIVNGLLKECVEENATIALDQTEYNERYQHLSQRFTDIKEKLKGLDEKRLEQTVKQKSMRKFIKTLKKQDNLLTEFDEGLWFHLLENITVFADNKLTFTFKDGLNIEWTI